jgi:hypothetical protein
MGRELNARRREFLDSITNCLLPDFPGSAKKTDAAEYPEIFDRVGLLVNRPTGIAGLPFT